MLGRVITVVKKWRRSREEDMRIAREIVEIAKEHGVEAAVAHFAAIVPGMPKRRALRIARYVFGMAKAEVGVRDAIEILVGLIVVIIVAAIGFAIAYAAVSNNPTAQEAIGNLTQAAQTAINYAPLLVLAVVAAVVIKQFVGPLIARRVGAAAPTG